MRLVSAFLFVALTGSWALANDAKPADPKPELTKRKVPYRVVKTLPETGQVLLFDRIHATHVVAEVGQSLDGYLVEDIDEEEVTLLADGGAQVILTAPPPPRTARRTGNKAAAPADPYGAANPDGEANPQNGDAANPGGAGAASGPVPVDPYAEPEPPSVPGEGGVRVATAPHATAASSTTTRSVSAETAAPIIDSGAPDLSDPYGDPGIAAFADAVGATSAPEPAARPGKPAKPAKADPKPHMSSDDAASALAAAATGTPAPPAATSAGSVAPDSGASASGASASGASGSGASGSTTTTASAATATIARAELDAALADFGRLASSFRATFTPDGVRFDTIQDGTLLTRIGLRKGDVVTYVDGQPLRSLDDAASLYARAGAVRSTTLQVVRGGKLVTLRVAIQ